MTNVFINNYPAADDLLLVPRRGILSSRSKAELKPFIYSAPMDRVTGSRMAEELLAEGEIPVISRFLEEEEWYSCIKNFHSTPAFFGVGAKKEELLSFVEALLRLDAEDVYVNVAIDIAHGHSNLGLDIIAYLRELPCVRSIMSGSIATPEAAIDCIKAGATHLRVGIGPGSMCTTRQMTGIGVPNISAIHHIYRALDEMQFEQPFKKEEITIIADGGIKYPGDAVKYLAAGADAVMLGSVFSRCIESPGWKMEYIPVENGATLSFMGASRNQTRLTKTYRGQASAEFQKDKNKTSWCPEGASSNVIEWSNETVKSEISKFRGGMQSAISYLGLSSMSELCPENVEFIQISHSGLVEGTAHGKSTS